jgi:hypothetical protein
MRIFCENCLKIVHVEKEYSPMDIKLANGDIVSIIGQTTICSVCHEEIPNGEDHIINLEQATHVVELKEKYNEGEID